IPRRYYYIINSFLTQHETVSSIGSIIYFIGVVMFIFIIYSALVRFEIDEMLSALLPSSRYWHPLGLISGTT
ncbi:hypothetical protein L9F63_015077, partial [Diploptera punctata]